jgi:tRNA threonylcarbamoyl adenosine modification protein YeaZ
MIIFADTSKDDTRIALIKGSDFVEEITFESKGMQTELLLQNLEQLLKKQHLSKKDIKLLAIVKGPGSYTGLRIGLSTFNTLAFALNIPITGIPAECSDKKILSVICKVDQVPFEGPVLPVYLYAPKITKSARP